MLRRKQNDLLFCFLGGEWRKEKGKREKKRGRSGEEERRRGKWKEKRKREGKRWERKGGWENHRLQVEGRGKEEEKKR